MGTLKDFLSIKNDGEGLVKAATSQLPEKLSAIVAPVVIGGLGAQKKEEFTNKVTRLVQNDSFLSELSEEVALPLENESEDDFVERASQVMRNLLRRKFHLDK